MLRAKPTGVNGHFEEGGRVEVLRKQEVWGQKGSEEAKERKKRRIKTKVINIVIEISL